jgi:hypothetical protein
VLSGCSSEPIEDHAVCKYTKPTLALPNAWFDAASGVLACVAFSDRDAFVVDLTAPQTLGTPPMLPARIAGVVCGFCLYRLEGVFEPHIILFGRHRSTARSAEANN